MFQEADGQKTNNGIQYRLQLLYANGESIAMDILTNKHKNAQGSFTIQIPNQPTQINAANGLILSILAAYNFFNLKI